MGFQRAHLHLGGQTVLAPRLPPPPSSLNKKVKAKRLGRQCSRLPVIFRGKPGKLLLATIARLVLASDGHPCNPDLMYRFTPVLPVSFSRVLEVSYVDKNPRLMPITSNLIGRTPLIMSLLPAFGILKEVSSFPVHTSFRSNLMGHY